MAKANCFLGSWVRILGGIYVFVIVIWCNIIQYAATSEEKVMLVNGGGDDKPITFSVTPRDLPITLDTPDGGFSINASKPVQEPIDIYLENDDTSIATVSQTVTMKEGADSVDVNVKTVQIGSCTIMVNVTNFYKNTPQNASFSNLFVRVHVSRSYMVSLLSDVAGWFYTICWAVHLLPQLHLNYQRKSVVGLSFDYLLLSCISFVMFAIYNMMNYWSKEIQEAYLNDDPLAPGVDLVSVKDVVFSILNVVIITITCLQCLRYERGDQKVSTISKVLLVIITTIVLVLLIIVLASNERVITWDGYLDVITFVKLVVTFAKYIPQVYMNYSRKSTEGWSIAFAVLDCLCGVLLLLEMLLVAMNYGNWISFKHSPIRVCMVLFSIMFAIIFIVQHYVLYRLQHEEDTIPILGEDKGGNSTIQESRDDDELKTPGSEKEMKTFSKKK